MDEVTPLVHLSVELLGVNLEPSRAGESSWSLTFLCAPVSDVCTALMGPLISVWKETFPFHQTQVEVTERDGSPLMVRVLAGTSTSDEELRVSIHQRP